MKNILIVDDSALMRRVLSDIIDDNKELNAAYLAEDGVEALEILDSGAKVDAIVLDINMPRMDGIAFLKVLNERHQREKVLIVSTLAQKGGAETIRALELGAFDFITKPTSLSEAKGPFFINMFIRMLMWQRDYLRQDWIPERSSRFRNRKHRKLCLRNCFTYKKHLSCRESVAA